MNPVPSPLPELLIDLTRKLDADSLIYWSFEEEENVLVARCCPSVPTMEGFRQGLDRGLISQAFVTGLPILENQIKEHHLHDPTFDEASGKNCQSLLAVPVIHESELLGILSAATFDEGKDRHELGRDDLENLREAAKKLFTN